jgi:outer membrane receptor protein involved in Fe transport
MGITLNLTRVSRRAALLGLFVAWFSVLTLHAQEGGKVAGVLVSTWDGSPLAGATVTVRGTTLAAQTGANGQFELKNVPVGDQELRFSKSGYAAATVTEVRVLSGQTTTVSGNLRPEFYELEEYEVTAEEFQEQTEQIMFDRQQSSSVTDAIGANMFKNLAVGDAAGALSKVTGATVADGKYAVIRGLSDRYTFTTLNGSDLPSADPDRKAFQLDLMPSKFIEKIDVAKTFTPDMNGNFAGGSVDIVTKSYPEEFMFEFRVGTAYNTQSSLRDDFAMSDQGSRDWLGMDDGTRELPASVAATSPSGQVPLPPDVEDDFNSTQLAPVSGRSPLDLGTELLIGFTDEVFGKKVGVLGGFNYKNQYRYYDDGVIRSYDVSRTLENDKTEVLGVIEYQWGALGNISLELNEYHELKFNVVYIQSAEDEARRVQGYDGGDASPDSGTYLDQSILHWTERNLAYFQLGGGHEAPGLNGLRLDWAGVLATTTQDEPDYRIFQFLADTNNSFYNPDVAGASPTTPTRYWRELAEDNTSLRADLTLPLPSYNSGENKLKGGVAMSVSERDYSQRGYSMVRSGAAGLNHPFYNVGDPNIWMLPENLQYILVRNFPVNLTYLGEQTVNAGYLMGDWAVLDWLQLVGGARYETTDLSIDGYNQTRNQPLPSGQIDQSDILPALTTKLRLSENVDLQAAWSSTIVRPTYREIAAVPIYDVTQARVYIGNPNLEISDSANYDLRLSWYPRPGEIVSASVFAKTIKAPIEQASVTIDNSIVSYANFDQADLIGVEGEFRLGLDRMWESLKPLTFGFNAAYIQSEVPLTEEQMANRANFGDTSTHRPLYNQPEYILNADLTWDIAPTRTTVTLSGGIVGESLVLIGLASPDEYLQPAPELNFFIRQRIGKNWDVRFTAKNLLNPKQEIAQTWPTGEKLVLESYTKGITLGISVGCEF